MCLWLAELPLGGIPEIVSVHGETGYLVPVPEKPDQRTAWAMPWLYRLAPGYSPTRKGLVVSGKPGDAGCSSASRGTLWPGKRRISTRRWCANRPLGPKYSPVVSRKGSNPPRTV